MTNIKDITDAISESKKYNSLHSATIDRIVQNVAQRYPEKEVENEAKKKLHQIWSAYYSTRPDFEKLTEKIKAGIEVGEDAKEILLPILRIHTSTEERIPILNDLYKQIFAITGTPQSVTEHACGLNALTLPWMQLPATANYTAFDIDVEEISFINEVFRLLKFSDNAHAEVEDLFEIEYQLSHIVFLFKIIPLIEQQNKNGTEELLSRINATYTVVSFPTTSLSGINKGMVENYSTQFETLLNNKNWKYNRLEFPTELVYIVTR